MKKRNLIALVVIALLVVAVPIVWWLASPLFLDQTVDEDFPLTIPSAGEIDAMAPAEAEMTANAIIEAVEVAGDEMSEEAMAAAESSVMALAAKMPDKEMNDAMAGAGGWQVAAQGTFVDADSFHQGAGTATIFVQGEERVLRFEEFSVTNGPDLHVLLVENIEGTSHDDIGEYIDLGPLKGNMGNQNYPVPAEVDLAQYAGVMIYCMPFHVVFATAAF